MAMAMAADSGTAEALAMVMGTALLAVDLTTDVDSQDVGSLAAVDSVAAASMEVAEGFTAEAVVGPTVAEVVVTGNRG
jgi:hypothetical protein